MQRHEVEGLRRPARQLSRSQPTVRVVLYRIRRYSGVGSALEAFNMLFEQHLLPIQERHGARLVGRWATNADEVIAVWEYDDVGAYEKVQAAVAADPDSAVARDVRAGLGRLFTEVHESFGRSTVQSL